MRTQLWRTVAVSVLILGLAGTMLADDSKDSTDDASSNMMAMEARLARQEARIGNLEVLVREQMALIVDARQELALLRGPTHASSTTDSETEVARSAPEATPAATPRPQAASSAGWTSSHAYVNSANNDLTMQFSGRMHLDFRGYTDEETPDSTLVLRRARITVEGNLFDNYSYKVETDFADRGSALLRDAYVNARFDNGFQLRFGQFKAPFSQERLQSSLRVNFVDRSSLSALSPGRSPGIMLHGSFRDDAVSYGLSVSNGLGILSTVPHASLQDGTGPQAPELPRRPVGNLVHEERPGFTQLASRRVDVTADEDQLGAVARLVEAQKRCTRERRTGYVDGFMAVAIELCHGQPVVA